MIGLDNLRDQSVGPFIAPVVDALGGPLLILFKIHTVHLRQICSSYPVRIFLLQFSLLIHPDGVCDGELKGVSVLRSTDNDFCEETIRLL